MAVPRRLLALTLALACKPSDADDTDDTTATQSDTTATTAPTSEPTDGSVDICPDNTIVDSCCCFEAGGAENGGVEVHCPAEALCSPMLATCKGADFTDCTPDDAASVEAIDCMVDALMSIEPGSVSWTLSSAGDTDVPIRSVVVYTPGTGKVYWTGEDYTGLTTEILGVDQYEFTAGFNLNNCSVETDPKIKFACLAAAFSQPEAVCVAPYML